MLEVCALHCLSKDCVIKMQTTLVASPATTFYEQGSFPRHSAPVESRTTLAISPDEFNHEAVALSPALTRSNEAAKVSSAWVFVAGSTSAATFLR